MSEWKTGLYILLTLVLLSMLRNRMLRRGTPSRLPPGPRPWPVVDNLWTMYRLHKDSERVLKDLSDAYGDICGLWLGSHPIMVINTAAVAHDLLQKRGAFTSLRPENSQLRLEYGRGRLVLTPAGQDFMKLRRLYHKLLGPESIRSHRNVLERESVILIDELERKPSLFYESVERYALSIVFTLTYGVWLKNADNDIVHGLFAIWNNLLSYFYPGTLLLPETFPFLLQMPKLLQPWRWLANNLVSKETQIHRGLLSPIRFATRSSPAPYCFTTTLLEWQKSKELDDFATFGILAMIVGAGSDTTSSVLQNLFKVMALHPDVVDAAHQELDDKIGRGRLPTWEDETQLPYLRALIKELHRWAPIGCPGIAHAASRTFSYREFTVYRGMILIPNLVTLNRDPNRYSRPEVFAPSRFFGDELGAAASAVHADPMKRDHFHYRFGRRLCQGVDTGEASLFIAISRILWAFDIRAEPGCELDMLDKIYGLATKPKPFKVAIVPRDPSARRILSNQLQQVNTVMEKIPVV